MMRKDGRAADELRKTKLIEDFISSADASVLVEAGKTRVLCTATVESNLPKWMHDKKRGWVTAEYSLLPRSTGTRVKRERGSISGRTQEIQRLIGRSLRGVCNLDAIGEKSIIIDCDVLEADGGTRTASVVGAFYVLVKALRNIPYSGRLPRLKSWLAATSVGIVDGVPVLDLNYEEDVEAEVDMNLVMNESGDFVELQGTGEESTFSRDQLNELLDLGKKGCGEWIELMKSALGSELP